MAKTYNRLEIDVNKKPNSIGIRPVQHDTKSRYLDVCLYENGVPINLTGEQVRITFRKADGSTFFNQGEVTDATAGRCQFALTNEILSEAKAVEAQISVWNAGGQILSTQVFEIYVTAAIPWTDAVESENEYGVLVVLFQEIQDALDTMHKIATTFGEPGDKAAEYGVDTFWGILETLAQRGDVESALHNQIKTYLNSTVGTSGFISLDKMFIIHALLSDEESLNEWAFRQVGIGSVINSAFDLNSLAVASCDTMEKLVASSTAVEVICANRDAALVCVRNETFAKKVIATADTKTILTTGLGYQKYNVGDTVSIDYNGKSTAFRVVHKNYMTQNKIVLVSEDILGTSQWASGHNNYSASTIREYLNSTVLKGFSDEIQTAIVISPVSCHDGQDPVTCMDKIWALSLIEIGFSASSSFPVEGSKLSYFDDSAKRIKKLNGYSSEWLVRTPDSGSGICIVNSSGGRETNYNSTNRMGIVPAFEI